MIPPRKVKFEARKKLDENFAFRTFLKIHADEKELDEQFRELHEELFAKYDCSRCRNCCKMFRGCIPLEELQRDAAYLHMSEKEFMKKFLVENEQEGAYDTKHKPCDFLEADGNCILGECRPDACKKYPHTNQPERLESLLSVLDTVEVCPVAFEIYERLKEIYGFQYRK